MESEKRLPGRRWDHLLRSGFGHVLAGAVAGENECHFEVFERFKWVSFWRSGEVDLGHSGKLLRGG